MSDSLWPQGLYHASLPCPSLVPGVCSNSCALSRWCYLTIISSVTLFSFAFSLSQHQGFFQWVSSYQVAKVLELQLQSLRWIFRADFLQDGLVRSPCSPRDSQESSPTPQFKSIHPSALSLLMVQPSHLYVTTGKTIALTTWTFVFAF